MLSAVEVALARLPYFLEALEALGRAFSLAGSRPGSLGRVSGPPFSFVSTRFFEHRCDRAVKRFFERFFIDLSCFFDRRRHSFSIAPLVVFGDRAAMSYLAKPLQNIAHAQKN